MSYEDEYLSDPAMILVNNAQMAAVREADKQRDEERRKTLLRRREAGETDQTMNELLKDMLGDEETAKEKLNAELDRVNKEVADHMQAEKERNRGTLRETKFPIPPTRKR